MQTLHTKRLTLRPWTQEDLPALAAICADAKVMEYFLHPLSPEESQKLLDKFMEHFEEHGWGLFAACLTNSNELIGFIGLAHVPFQASFTPAVEIGWRLSSKHWGQGYATEGAQAVLKFAFETLKLPELVSFTPKQNKRSEKVMQRLHMTLQEEFDHPWLPPGHPLQRHLLYRLTGKEWQKYTFKPHNSLFPELFAKEKKRLEPHLPPQTLIEHIGSSSIEGLGGKGIIDLAIGVDPQEIEVTAAALQTWGYRLTPHFASETRKFLKMDRPDPLQDTRTYHVHLLIKTSSELQQMLFFRDHLRSHPELTKEYSALKTGAAEVYRKQKEPFIAQILSNLKK